MPNISAAEEEKKSLQAKFQEDTNPHRSCLNHFCKALGYLTSLVALIMGIMECFGFFYLQMTLLENILSAYLILFCILIIFTEMNLFDVAKESKILNLWALRGLFYVFVGIMGLNSINTSIMVQGALVERSLFQNLLVIFSIILSAIGVVYIALGLLCVQIVNDRMERDYQDRQKRAVDIKHAAHKYGALAANSDTAASGTNYVV